MQTVQSAGREFAARGHSGRDLLCKIADADLLVASFEQVAKKLRKGWLWASAALVLVIHANHAITSCRRTPIRMILLLPTDTAIQWEESPKDEQFSRQYSRDLPPHSCINLEEVRRDVNISMGSSSVISQNVRSNFETKPSLGSNKQ